MVANGRNNEPSAATVRMYAKNMVNKRNKAETRRKNDVQVVSKSGKETQEVAQITVEKTV